MPMQVCELLHEVERASGLEMKELIARKEADVAELETHQCPPPCLPASSPPRLPASSPPRLLAPWLVSEKRPYASSVPPVMQ
jgi:hypothetical protein